MVPLVLSLHRYTGVVFSVHILLCRQNTYKSVLDRQNTDTSYKAFKRCPVNSELSSLLNGPFQLLLTALRTTASYSVVVVGSDELQSFSSIHALVFSCTVIQILPALPTARQ